MIGGVIAEFNPLHKGHKYLIDKMREQGADTVVAVMSGNFVQRGDSAIISKWARAKCALYQGVDLVIELPVRFSVAGAMKFATGGVSLLSAVGADRLFFGSECGSKEEILKAVKAVDEADEKIRQLLNSGISYASARQQASGIDILSNPNDTLGIEYVSAIQRLQSKMDFLPIKRVGVGHDGGKGEEFASASYIRQNLKEAEKFMPKESFEIFKAEIDNGRTSSLLKSENSLLIKLRGMTLEEIRSLPDVSEGLPERIFSAVKEATSLSGLINAVKTKRYTEARIRRILLSALLSIDKSEISKTPQYIHPLAFNQKGASLLKNAALPIISKAKEGDLYSDFALECKADDIYALLLEKPQEMGLTKTQGVIRK